MCVVCVCHKYINIISLFLRVNKTTLDYGEVVEATFWQFKFKCNCCGHILNEQVLGKIAK